MRKNKLYRFLTFGIIPINLVFLVISVWACNSNPGSDEMKSKTDGYKQYDSANTTKSGIQTRLRSSSINSMKSGFVDDSKDIQEAINVASKNGSHIVYLETGRKYILKKPIKLYNGIIINGNGAVIEPSMDWSSSNELYSAIFNLVNTKNVEIRNLSIDHKGHLRNGSQAVFCSILMLGAQSCTIERVRFLNSGIKNSENSLPNDPQILIISQDKPNEFSYLTKRHRSICLSSHNNVIKNCQFINKNNTAVGFAIRVLSNWEDHRPQNSFKNKTSDNEISHCRFEGEFSWNTIELAGGGTVGTAIKYDTVIGKSINNLDIDKGASNNIISNNLIRSAGLPERFKGNKNVRCSPIMVHGTTSNYISYNNKVIDNKIINVINPSSGTSRYLYSSAIGALCVDSLIISGNQIQNVYPNCQYGGGIVLDQECKNININNNTISNAHWGIVFTANGLLLNNVKIKSNNISSRSIGIYLPTRKGGKFNNGEINDNEISIIGTKTTSGIYVGNESRSFNIEKNTLKGNINKVKAVSAKSSKKLSNTFK